MSISLVYFLYFLLDDFVFTDEGDDYGQGNGKKEKPLVFVLSLVRTRSFTPVYGINTTVYDREQRIYDHAQNKDDRMWSS